MSQPSFSVVTGDCRLALEAMQPESVDACVTDPPYELGADTLAGLHAVRLLGHERVKPEPADWDDVSKPGAVIRYRRGKPYNVLAGYWRNQLMLDRYNPDVCLAFKATLTGGTRDMVRRSLHAGIPTYLITPDGIHTQLEATHE